MIESSPAVQDHYPDDFARCYGCGPLNDHGLHLKSRWEEDELVARFSPESFHMAAPGIVYGGLIASLLDCHGMATAAAAAGTLREALQRVQPELARGVVKGVVHKNMAARKLSRLTRRLAALG